MLVLTSMKYKIIPVLGLSLLITSTAPASSITFDPAIKDIFKKACVACHQANQWSWKLCRISRFIHGSETHFRLRRRRSKHASAPYNKVITDEERKLIQQWVSDGAPLKNQ